MRVAPVLVFCLGTLVACGGSGGDGGGGQSSDPNAPVPINSYTITGTSAPVNNVVQIETQVNEGKFTVNLAVPPSTLHSYYWARIAVSADQSFVEADDLQLVQGCGKTSIVDSCRANVTWNCTYSLENTSYVVRCVDPANNTYTAHLTHFFGGAYPVSTNIVANVCNGLFSACNTSSIAVLFN